MPVVLGIFAHGAAKVIDGVYVVHILFEHKNLLLGILSLFLLFYLRILLFSNFHFGISFDVLPTSDSIGAC